MDVRLGSDGLFPPWAGLGHSDCEGPRGQLDKGVRGVAERCLVSRRRTGSALGVERRSGAVRRTYWRPGEAGAIRSAERFHVNKTENHLPSGRLYCRGGANGKHNELL